MKSAGTQGILDLMSAGDRAGLLSLGHALECRGKSLLFQKGDPGNGFYIITAGNVSIRVNSAGGKEIIFNKLSAGDVFGEIAMLDGAERTADAVAAAGTKLVSVDRTRFFGFLDKKPALYGIVIRHLCERMRYCSAQTEGFALADGFERLVSKLVYLAGTGGRKKRALVEISQSDLAKMLGLSREAVNKNLRDLQARNLVTLGQKKITISDVGVLGIFQRRRGG